MSRLKRLQGDEKVQRKAMRLRRYFVLTRIISHFLVLSFSGATCEIERKSGSQFSELYSVFQMSQVSRIVIVSLIVLVFVIFS